MNERVIASAALDGQSFLLYNRFKSDRLAERMGNLYRTAKEIDPRHIVIVHAHSGTLQNWDDWLVARECDFYGTSTHEVPMDRLHDSRKGYSKFTTHLDIMRSAAGKKQYYWISELSGGTGIMAPTPPKRINERELLFNLWTSVAHGAKGIFFWQFKTEELVMQESPGGWGLVNLDGSETYRTKEFRSFAAVIRKHEKLFVNLKSLPAETGLLYLPEMRILQQMLRFPGYAEAFFGAHYALWISNINFDLIRFPEDMARYKTIYCPMPWIVNRDAAAAIRTFIANGGKFVCDGGLAWYNEDGWLSRKVPGYGFAEEAGFVEKDIRYLDTVDIKVKNILLKSAREKRLIEITDGKKCRIIGKFKDGTPAVLSAKIGKGELVYFASCVSACFSGKEDPAAAVKLIDFLGISPSVRISPVGQITCRVLEHENKNIYFVFNHSVKKQEVKTSIPGHAKLSLAGKEVKIIGLK